MFVLVVLLSLGNYHGCMTETMHYKVHSTIERVILHVRIIPYAYALHFFLNVSQQQ